MGWACAARRREIYNPGARTLRTTIVRQGEFCPLFCVAPAVRLGDRAVFRRREVG
jgi:hypothetical protein